MELKIGFFFYIVGFSGIVEGGALLGRLCSLVLRID